MNKQKVNISLQVFLREYTNLSSLLRDYSDIRWDRRFVLKRDQLERGLDHEFKVLILILYFNI